MAKEGTTRYYSELQEEKVAKLLNGTRNANSGGGKFKKGDVTVKNANLLVECKTSMSDKSSFSVKKEWLDKNKKESFENRFENSCLCFNFGPESPNYFVINEKLMKFLCNQLEEFYDDMEDVFNQI